jgi:AbrB family looped-hinge helix DNA binding protein
MNEATLTQKGQVTVPKDVRDSLKVEAGDKLLFVLDGDKAVVYPVREGGLRGLRGIFKGRAPYEGKKAQREAARRFVAEHAMRVSRNDDDTSS